MTDKRKKTFLFLSSLILSLAFCSTVWFINSRIDFILNSDDSSELVLSHLLASENALISPNWYYSTELRVLNVQIFFTFFFKIFNEWHTVRIASYICLYLVLLASYYYTCKELHIQKYFPITATLLMLPFSGVYFWYVLKAPYYIPHIAITFFTIGLYEQYINEKQKRNEYLYLSMASLCAILAGIGGPRQMIILYIPLALASMAIALSNIFTPKENIVVHLSQDDKKYICFSFISLVGAVIGYGINTRILSYTFKFKQWTDISFIKFDLSTLSQIINGFLSSFGYKTGKIFSSALLANFTCACWVILIITACIYLIKNKKTAAPAHYRVALLMIAAVITFTILYLFTNLAYADRYNLPIMILSIPLTAIAFQNLKLSTSLKHLSITLFILLIAISGVFFYKGKYDADWTKDFRNIVTVLQNEQRTEGYASFWNANILTELSNGTISVWDWQDSGPKGYITISDIDHTYKWLQLVSHDSTHPQGKIFLLFSQNEWKHNPWVGKLSTKYIIYQSPKFIVIGYDSYDALRRDTNPQ